MSGLRGYPRHAAVRGALICLLLLAGCAVSVQPKYQMPRPLLQPMKARVGLVLDDSLRNFVQEETRGTGNWKIELGAGHAKLFRNIFADSFQPLQVFDSLDAARKASGLQVIFEPAIDQYSFATDKETSGYWAVTIRYRIAVLDPAGAPVDSFTLTGYGSTVGQHGSKASLAVATRLAMRDAAAKFLVQMPRQRLAQKLIAGKTIGPADKDTERTDVVETVPIEPAEGG
jgi:hypothetical protein